MLILVLFIFSWYTSEDKTHGQLTSTLVGLAVDATCDHVSTSVSTALNRLLPPASGTEPLDDTSQHPAAPHLYAHLLSHIETLLHAASSGDGYVPFNVSFLVFLID